MKYYKQTIPGSCNIIALQTLLSYFDIYPDFESIKEKLPEHSFGSWLTEMGIYLEKVGFETRIFTNNKNPGFKFNDSLSKSLQDYEKLGTVMRKVPQKSDLNEHPFIVNVDSFKILKKEGGPGPHYVVLVKEDGKLYMYDGYNFDRRISTNFDEIYAASFKMNDLEENGLWLFVDKEPDVCKST